MYKKSNKTKIFVIFISLIFTFVYSGVGLSYQNLEGVKKGLVLIVDDERNFFFIDLGQNKVEVGDLIEVYRDSDRIATASVKRVMKNMSEASILKKIIRIDIGDRVVVKKAPPDLTMPKKAAITISQLKEKIRQLEEKKSIEEKLKVLDEAERLAKKTFKAQLTFLEESKKEAIKALDKKLKVLKEKERDARERLETKISSLKHAKEFVEKGLAPTKTIDENTLAVLEKKLGELEKSKRETLEDLRREIETLEEKRLKVETLTRPEPEAEYLGPKKEDRLDELEEKLKREAVRYKPLEESYIDKKGKPLTLEECISIAIENHLPLKIAKKQLKLAEMRLVEATRKLGPDVTLKWELSDGQVSGRYYDGHRIALETKQPIFYGGELMFSVKQAKVNLEIVRNDYDRIKNDLILSVKKGYYNLDKAEKALDIQKELHKKTKELYEITRTGYDSGVISQVELLKVSSQYNQTGFQVSSAEEDASIANLILQQAMNVDRQINIVPLAEPKIIELQLEDCFDLAYLNRPELKITRLSLEHYEYEKKIMEARAHWPRVDILGMYGNMREDFIKYDLGGGDEPRSLGPEYYIGTKVSVPLWGSTLGYSFTKEDWQPVVRTLQGTKANTHEFALSFLDKLEDFSSLSEAELEYMRSQDDMNKRKQEVTLEVKEAFFKYKKAIFMMDVAESKLEFQTKQTNIVDLRRELGEAQYSDVIDEMIRLAEEKFSYLQAVSDYYIAIAMLNKAIGLDGYFVIHR